MPAPLRKLLHSLPVSAAFALLILAPDKAASAASAGIDTCLRSVIPALFPILTVTNALLRLGPPAGLLRVLGVPFERLFRIRRSALPVLLLGFLGGFPLGAASAAACCRRGDCDSREAERLMVFANNCSPGFLLGLVSGHVPGGRRTALLLLLVQWAVSLYLGWILGLGHRLPRGEDRPDAGPSPSPAELLTSSVREGGRTVLLICAYVIFFSVLAAFLPAQPLLRGALELTGGVLLLQGNGLWTTVTAAFLLGFGGLAAACQSVAAVEGSGLRTGGYLPLRLLHGLLSALCTACLLAGPAWFPLPLLAAAGLGFIAKRGRKPKKSVV